uniref:histidine kinase n=1 Tax=Yoonia rhodophyticola TaxID=3137370 RepID=A0AAN0NJ61_9RHOB
MRRDVLARWEADGDLDPEAYPIEVAPLVKDINVLLERNREIVNRSRRQSADLAHAIKTPSAIVRNELEKMQAAGQPVQQSIDALDRLDAQLKRSFARMRADGGNAAMHTFTDLDTSLGRFTRAFAAMARNDGKILTTDIPPGLRVRMDSSDFDEIIGNLLDNALKWSHSMIHLSAREVGDFVDICVEDDGDGIPEDDYGSATLSGQRLDTSKPGTGLGLAIASDLAHAYGGKIQLSVSDMFKGLHVRIHLKHTGV